jgi:co-chaperonin GroES (HSP10)
MIHTPNGIAPPQRRVQFVPNGDRYLIQEMDHNETQKSLPTSVRGILLPDTADGTLGWYGGLILEAGNGHRLEADVTVPMFFKRGDTVVVVRLAGHDVYFGGSKYKIVNQADILGAFHAVE